MPIKFSLSETSFNNEKNLPKKDFSGLVLRHICEVCGKDEVLDVEQAFNEDWDYPPKFCNFKVLSPRTCGDCGINQTLWWDLVVTGEADSNNLNRHHKEILNRILTEPQSVYVPETDVSKINFEE